MQLSYRYICFCRFWTLKIKNDVIEILVWKCTRPECRRSCVCTMCIPYTYHIPMCTVIKKRGQMNGGEELQTDVYV